MHTLLRSLIVLGCLWGPAFSLAETEPREWRQTVVIAAPEAMQAAAADDEYVYAVSSTQIARYDRKTGERLAASTGPARHLNSAFLWEGSLYCAHSNYPTRPEQSEIKALDLATMELTTYHNFGESDGSLTWCVRHAGAWWCNFAFYGADNGRSYLARFDDEWKETGRWTYPAEVLKSLGRYSFSGGIFQEGDLLTTGHDDPVLFRLSLPEGGGELVEIARDRIPFSGQGIAIDPVTEGLVGIHRARKQIVLAAAPVPSRLRVLTYNIHHGAGLDGQIDPERIARVIRSAQPDLVAVQEVDRDVPRSNKVDQPAELARLTGLNAVRGENIELQGGGYGNLILSRWPIRKEINHPLPQLRPGEQRGVLDVEVAWPGRDTALRFMATHFDHRPDETERLASVEQINKLVADRPDELSLLAGDLNAVPDSATLTRLDEQWTRTTRESQPTFPAESPNIQIDYILYRPAARWRVVECRVLEEAVASDHRAVLAVLELVDPAAEAR